MNPLQLREPLECPVCFHVRRGPIYVCKTGHSVCGFCYDRLPAAPKKTCPMARCGFLRPVTRNLMVEKMIAGGGIAADCDNADQGCQETGVGEEELEEQGECLHREVPCPATYCQESVRLSQLREHFTAVHWHSLEMKEYDGFTVYTGLEDDMDWSWDLDLPLEKEGAKFYRQLVMREGSFYAWVKVEGGAKEAAKWSCGIAVRGTSVVSCAVHPIDRSVEEVLQTGAYLLLNNQQVRIWAWPDGEGGEELDLNFTFSVEKK